MKKITHKIIFAVLITLLLSSTWKCSISAAELELRIHDYDEQYSVESNVDLTVLIQNKGKDSILLPALFIPEDYYIRFVIENSDGDKIAFIGAEMDLIQSNIDIYQMRPNSIVGQEIDLKKYYKLVPGSYTLYAVFEITDGRRNEEGSWVGKLRSNEINFVVR